MPTEKKKYYRYEYESEDSRCFVLKEKFLYGANRNCFTSKKEATTHFKKAQKIALKKYENIMNGIYKLKELLGDFSYDYFVTGDTYGIESEGLYIYFEVDGYNFQFLQ